MGDLNGSVDSVARAAAAAAASSANAAQLTADEALPKLGRTDASEPPDGQVGQVISSTVLIASAVNCPNNTAIDITSIVLTPGDWDVVPSVNVIGAGGATAAFVLGGASQTSAVLPGATNRGLAIVNGAGLPASPGVSVPCKPRRINVAVPTTVYLSAYVGTLAVGTATAYGEIFARRAS